METTQVFINNDQIKKLWGVHTHTHTHTHTLRERERERERKKYYSALLYVQHDEPEVNKMDQIIHER
jgi:hypothetical protein